MPESSGKELFPITPQMVDEVDSRVEQPIVTYSRVLTAIKQTNPNLTQNDLILFSAHFLVNAFDPTTDYGRMAKALLANIYYLHYMSEIPNGLQHSSRERPKDEGVARPSVEERTPDPNDRDSGSIESSVQAESSSSLSAQVEDPTL